MSRRPQVAWLADGRRLHLNDGPIDLVIEAFGAADAREAAHAAAIGRFTGLLDELCDELPTLRQPASQGTSLRGPVARRMHRAVAPLAARMFITPMAAVAGAVADEILAAMTAAAPLARAYVNNGGDIAVHLTAGERFAIGLVDRPDRPRLFASATVAAGDGVGGIATSGWRGRSFSLGIADAATILAASAAAADAAATAVANAVDLPGDRRIERRPARSLQPDTDLGDHAVTCGVPPLGGAEIEAALARGLAEARRLAAAGLIQGAALHLQGETRAAGRGLTALGHDRPADRPPTMDEIDSRALEQSRRVAPMTGSLLHA